MGDMNDSVVSHSLDVFGQFHGSTPSHTFILDILIFSKHIVAANKRLSRDNQDPTELILQLFAKM